MSKIDDGWSVARLKINPTKMKAIKDTLEIIDLFYDLNEPEASVTEWLRKPNEKFNGFSPAELIAAGKAKIVTDELRRLIDGVTL